MCFDNQLCSQLSMNYVYIPAFNLNSTAELRWTELRIVGGVNVAGSRVAFSRDDNIAS